MLAGKGELCRVPAAWKVKRQRELTSMGNKKKEHPPKRKKKKEEKR